MLKTRYIDKELEEGKPNGRYIDNLEIPGIAPGERLASTAAAGRRHAARQGARQAARQTARQTKQANQDLPEILDCQYIGYWAVPDLN